MMVQCVPGLAHRHAQQNVQHGPGRPQALRRAMPANDGGSAGGNAPRPCCHACLRSIDSRAGNWGHRRHKGLGSRNKMARTRLQALHAAHADAHCLQTPKLSWLLLTTKEAGGRGQRPMGLPCGAPPVCLHHHLGQRPPATTKKARCAACLRARSVTYDHIACSRRGGYTSRRAAPCHAVPCRQAGRQGGSRQPHAAARGAARPHLCASSVVMKTVVRRSAVAKLSVSARRSAGRSCAASTAWRGMVRHGMAWRPRNTGAHVAVNEPATHEACSCSGWWGPTRIWRPALQGRR